MSKWLERVFTGRYGPLQNHAEELLDYTKEVKDNLKLITKNDKQEFKAFIEAVIDIKDTAFATYHAVHNFIQHKDTEKGHKNMSHIEPDIALLSEKLKSFENKKINTDKTIVVPKAGIEPIGIKEAISKIKELSNELSKEFKLRSPDLQKDDSTWVAHHNTDAKNGSINLSH